MGKKKKPLPPQRKRMKRSARLKSARATCWVEKYTGKNIIRGYRNWYGVDELCAVVELRALGVAISAERETQAREKAIAAEARKMAKQEQAGKGYHPDSDDTFAYIAGYTSAGLPYGTTWEELEENGKNA